jgi:hypothetical protein
LDAGHPAAVGVWSGRNRLLGAVVAPSLPWPRATHVPLLDSSRGARQRDLVPCDLPGLRGRGQGHRRVGSPVSDRVTGGVGEFIWSQRGPSRLPGGRGALLAEPASPSPTRWSNVGVPRAASGRVMFVDGWPLMLCKTPPKPGPPTRWKVRHETLGEPARHQAFRRVYGERVLDAHCSRKVRGILRAIASPVR